MADNVKEMLMDEVLKAVKQGKVKSVHIEMEGGEEHEMGVDEEEKSSGMVCPECGCKMEPKEECPECGYETEEEEASEPAPEEKKEREMSPAHKREMERQEARTKVKDEDTHPEEEQMKNIEKLKEYSKKK